MKCPKCKHEAEQFMADWSNDLTRRFYKCRKCNHIIVVYVYSPVPWDKVSIEGSLWGSV